jgi:predicted phage gp36 major capsid-like protein
MGSNRAAAERVEMDDEDEPKSSADLAIEEMMERLDAALAGGRESMDALNRSSLELRRNLTERKVDSRPKLRAVLGSVPPPGGAE